MEQLRGLIEQIIGRVDICLREMYLDVGPNVRSAVPLEHFAQFYAFYSITSHHPTHFKFNHSCLGGTYFLGRCEVKHSVLYKCDIRGDELKSRCNEVVVNGIKIRPHSDETIEIKDSFLIKTLVHNSSHDPEHLDEFRIVNTVTMPYANIHGTAVDGGYLGAFATVDLSMCHDVAVGDFSYVQVGQISHKTVESGRIWIRAEHTFEFNYWHQDHILRRYVEQPEGAPATGIFIDFIEAREHDYDHIYKAVEHDPVHDAPEDSTLSPYSVIKGKCSFGQNVLVAQRAYIDSSTLGDGANAQENCYIVHSTYDGLNVTAHGGKVIYCHLGRKTFVGFNSFLRGSEDAPVTIGEECIVMPHTILDAKEPIDIPSGCLVWGYIRTQADLEENTLFLDDMANLRGQFFRCGDMTFEGFGDKFVDGFRHRIEHILEENGAYFDGTEETKGHAQKTRNIAFNILKPYPDGKLRGLYPFILIDPLEEWDC